MSGLAITDGLVSPRLLFTAAEESSSLLVKQLNQERDQLVDAIADQIKPGAASLTAELVSSLEVRRCILQTTHFSLHVAACIVQAASQTL